MPSYPPKDFLRDFADWQASAKPRGGQEAAKFLFSMRYGQVCPIFVYRLNRFICILDVLHRQLPVLVQDRLASRTPDGGGDIPEDLILALHEWYCSLTEAQMHAMPDPDWAAVLAIFDRVGDKPGGT